MWTNESKIQLKKLNLIYLFKREKKSNFIHKNSIIHLEPFSSIDPNDEFLFLSLDPSDDHLIENFLMFDQQVFPVMCIINRCDVPKIFEWAILSKICYQYNSLSNEPNGSLLQALAWIFLGNDQHSETIVSIQMES